MIRWRVVGRTAQARAGPPPSTSPGRSRRERHTTGVAQWTRQNHDDISGRYRVYLAHALQTRGLPNGIYHVEVAVSDVCGNRTTARASLSIDNGSSL